MTDVFGPNWKEPGALIYNSIITILALATTFTLSDCLMYLHNQRRPEETVLPVMGTLTAFASLLIMIGPTFGVDGMHLRWAGMQGLFGSLVVTVCSCWVFLKLCQLKKLRLSFCSEGADPILPHIFTKYLFDVYVYPGGPGRHCPIWPPYSSAARITARGGWHPFP